MKTFRISFTIESENAQSAADYIHRTYPDIKSFGVFDYEKSPTVAPPKSPTKKLVVNPESKWPLWAKAMKRFAKPEDKGIGDVVARMIGDTNSEAFKMWYLRQFGKICGCAGRQAQWNMQFPLEHETAA